MDAKCNVQNARSQFWTGSASNPNWGAHSAPSNPWTDLNHYTQTGKEKGYTEVRRYCALFVAKWGQRAWTDEWNARTTILRITAGARHETRRRSAAVVGSALPDGGVQVGKILVLHGVVGGHPSLRVAHQQTLWHENTVPSNAQVQTVQPMSMHLRAKKFQIFSTICIKTNVWWLKIN